MRVASNKLKDILDFYYSELINTYDRHEIEAIISIALHHYLGFSKVEFLEQAYNFGLIEKVFLLFLD